MLGTGKGQANGSLERGEDRERLGEQRQHLALTLFFFVCCGEGSTVLFLAPG